MTCNVQTLDEKSANLLRKISSTKGNIFSAKDVIPILNLSKEGVYKRLYELVKGGWLARLKKGVYYICPFEVGDTGAINEHEFVIAQYIVSPYAIGFWSALNKHGLTEQIPDYTYLLTTKRVSNPLRTIGSSMYKIVTISNGNFFGFQKIWFGSQRVNITDLEKTLVDALMFPKYCGGMIEVVKSFKVALDRIDFDKLINYALRMKKGVILKRLGILMDYFCPKNKERKKIIKNISKGVNLFDPQGDVEGMIISEWRIRMNFNLDVL